MRSKKAKPRRGLWGEIARKELADHRKRVLQPYNVDVKAAEKLVFDEAMKFSPRSNDLGELTAVVKFLDDMISAIGCCTFKVCNLSDRLVGDFSRPELLAGVQLMTVGVGALGLIKKAYEKRLEVLKKRKKESR